MLIINNPSQVEPFQWIVSKCNCRKYLLEDKRFNMQFPQKICVLLKSSNTHQKQKGGQANNFFPGNIQLVFHNNQVVNKLLSYVFFCN